MSFTNYSVALCTYNGAKYLAEQLNSILAQTFLPHEIVISDDGSTDTTLQVIESVMAESAVPYHVYTDNPKRGVVGNFWHAFSKCTCNVIFSCDQDDVWLPQKAEKVLKVFNDNPNALLVFSDAMITDENLCVKDTSLWQKVGFDYLSFDGKNAVRTLLSGPKVTGAAMAFKKQLFDVNENCPINMLHDEYLAFKAAICGGLYACNDKTILYRQHSDNVVGIKGKSLGRWFRNFSTIRPYREKEYLGWQLFSDRFGDKLTPNDLADVSARVEFWRDLSELKNNKKTQRYKTMKMHWKNGDYKRYYCGFRGLIRDCLIELL